MSDLDNGQTAPTKNIHIDPDLTPKHDDNFMRLAQEALGRRLPVYFALIPLSLCVPFDLDYRPDLHPAGQWAIDRAFEEGKTQGLRPMIVYPRGVWYVVSDHYITLFAAIRGNPVCVPTWVMGIPAPKYAQEIQGPLDAQQVRTIFGVGSPP